LAGRRPAPSRPRWTATGRGSAGGGRPRTAVAPAGGRDADPRRALAREAERVRQLLSPDWALAVLDETGARLSSVAFADRLARLEAGGAAGTAFVVGSDLGVDSSVKRDATLLVSLSDMTLPHLIARLVLWEQLFRATAILGGGGYHRAVVQ
jgi:23S rRNA (pseudouridine1915-N3)-methyltransferase